MLRSVSITRGDIGDFMHSPVLKNGASNDEVMCITEIYKAFTVVVQSPYSMHPHDMLHRAIIASNLRVQVTHDNDDVTARYFFICTVEGAVKFVLVSIRIVFSWCVSLYNGNISYSAVEPGNHHAIRDGSPGQQTVVCGFV